MVQVIAKLLLTNEKKTDIRILLKHLFFKIYDTKILRACFQIFLVLALVVYKFSIYNVYSISLPWCPIWKKSIFVIQHCDLYMSFYIDKIYHWSIFRSRISIYIKWIRENITRIYFSMLHVFLHITLR